MLTLLSTISYSKHRIELSHMSESDKMSKLIPPRDQFHGMEKEKLEERIILFFSFVRFFV